MTKVETPAEALNCLVKRCLQCNEVGSVAQALRNISDAITNDELLQFISIVDSLIAKIRHVIDKSDFDEDQRSDIGVALDSFRSIFNIEIMHADWKGVRGNALPPHHVQTLKMLGPGIKSVASQHELSSTEVRELEEEASSLFESVQNANLDEKVKSLVISHIRLIMFHLANYRIGGKKALRVAVSYVAGDIMAFRSEYKVDSEAISERSFIRFIGKMIDRLRTTSDDIERLEAVPENIEMIADLFGKSAGP